MTKIVKCNCKNEYQDKRYGAGMRVANALPKVQNRAQEYRCTVCKAVHS